MDLQLINMFVTATKRSKNELGYRIDEPNHQETIGSDDGLASLNASPG